MNESALSFKLGWENLRELGAHVGEDVVGSELEERLKSGHVCAHLDNVLESFLRFVFQVFGGVLEHVDGEETSGHVSFSEELAVFG